MPHSWVLDVLENLIAYARRNNLPGLAAGSAELRAAAAAELSRVAKAGPARTAEDAVDEAPLPRRGPSH
jgi:hypothetical protein